jgi:hypothetical protein
MASNKFKQITGDLVPFLDEEKEFNLAATAVTFSQVLQTIIQQLPTQTLSLSKANATPSDGPPATWVLTGTPETDWPVPGLKNRTVSIAGSTVTLTVTDKADADDPNKEPGYQLVFSGDVDLGGSHPSPVTLTLANDDATEAITQTVLIGDPTTGQDLPIGNFTTSFALGDVVDALNACNPLFPVNDAELISCTIVFTNDPSASDDPPKSPPPPPSVSSCTIDGSLTLGSVTIELSVQFSPDSSTQITLSWPSADHPGSCTINTLLSGIRAPFTLPDALDVTLRSFSIAYVPVDENDRLNSNDAHRVVLSSPADQDIPDFRITWSFDENAARRTVVRANWDEVSFGSLPVIGDHLATAKLEPLVMLLLTQQMRIDEVAALANMTDFPGLETLGTPADEVKSAPPMPLGIHCAAVFDVPDVVNIALHFPLYTASTESPRALPQSGHAKRGIASEDPSPSGQLSPSNETHSIPIQQNVGPVHLDSVGLRFEDEAVSVLLNVGLGTGGLQFELIGLRASIKVSDRSLSVGIDGLGISFASSGVSLAGEFVRDTQGATTDWGGTALIRVGETFAFQAAGAFSDDNPKSVFFFGYDKQQIGGPPWLVITGLAAGFGYNRAFVPPAVDEVDNFPFIQIANNVARGDPPKDGEPLNLDDLWNLMNGIETYLGPSDGSDFLTAGFTALSFGFVNSTVLASIVFGSKVEFVALGSSTLDVPPGAPIAHAELDVVASVDPSAGLIAIDGVLAPGSYVLSDACRLTGGFAIHLWFAGKHKGDFVYTYGGFSPNHTPPAHYPQVPRLGYIWKVSDEVLITGWSYFALTPGSVQAGGGLSISLNAGPLSAWCNATCDFYLQWMPVHYDIFVSVDFGVSFEMSLLFCTVTVSADIGAKLHVWGPDFSGHAEVDLWFVSFGLDIGANAPQSLGSVGLPSFVSGVLPPVSPSSTMLARAAFSDDPQPSAQQPLQIVPVNGTSAAPPGSGADWIVDPSRLVLSVATSMPAANLELNGNGIGPSLTIHAKPANTKIDPLLAVTTSASDGSTPTWLGTSEQTQVPGALYGDPNASGDDSQTVQGHVALILNVLADPPDQTVPIDQQVLLDDNFATFALAWQTPSMPQGGAFPWSSDNPFQTIRAPTVTATRSAILQVMANEGYLSADAIAGIDLEFVVASQPCFVDDPTLCRLGADQFS